jgi:predicted nucleotidyltransferase
MLFNVLDAALGDSAKTQILRALLRLEGPVSGREVERLAGITSHSAALRALGALSDLAILHREQAAGAHLYRINRDHDLVPALSELFAAEARRFGRIRDHLKDAVEQAALTRAVRSSVVFGSAARGDARPASDLDLLVIVAEDDDVESVTTALVGETERLHDRFGVRLSPMVLSQAQVEHRHRDGDPLMRNILDEGRTLLGHPFQEVVGAW